MPESTANPPPGREPSAAPPPARGERAAVWALLVGVLALRVVYAFRFRVDSDELQHLHVAWAWTQGLVQYRDVFDNHTPLFHLVMAPFVAAVGEGSRIVPLGRLAMLPCFAATLFATGRIGRAAFEPRAARWAPLVLAVVPEFFTTSLETRTDDLWAACWCLGLAIAVGGPWTRRRALGTGLLFGLALITSLKTLLLLGTLAAGALATRAFLPDVRRAWPLRRMAAAAGWTLLPVVAVAGAVVGLLAVLGAGDAFVRCVFVHSYVPGAKRPHELVPALAMLAGALAALALLAVGLRRTSLVPGDRGRQLLVLLAAGLHAAVLSTVWPSSTRQDALPVLPAAALAVAAVVAAAVAHRVRRRGPAVAGRTAVAAFALAVVLGVGRIGQLQWPWVDATQGVRRYIDEVLALTAPGETVLDPKGQAVFRPRPTYLVFEKFTRERLALGLLEDDVPEDLVRHRTAVASIAVGKFAPGTQRFLEAHYVPVGEVRVAGYVLVPPAAAPAAGAAAAAPDVAFDVAIPLPYAVVREDGRPFEGTLDGVPYAGPRELAAGPHAVRSATAGGRLAVVWARALARGFSPFGAPASDAARRAW